MAVEFLLFTALASMPADAFYLCPNANSGPNICLTYCEAFCREDNVACAYANYYGYQGMQTTVMPPNYDPQYYCSVSPGCNGFTVNTQTNQPSDPLTYTTVTQDCGAAPICKPTQ